MRAPKLNKIVEAMNYCENNRNNTNSNELSSKGILNGTNLYCKTCTCTPLKNTIKGEGMHDALKVTVL